MLVSGGAILGAAAIYNALSRKDVDNLSNLIGGDEGGFSWRGRRVAFTKRGDGPPILFLHNIGPASWSHEWRANLDYFAKSNTVFTLDLLGFGRSDRPPVRYTARMYISLISDFVNQVVGDPCAIVASGLSGAYATVLAARDPQRFPAIVLVTPTGLVRHSRQTTIGADMGRLAVDAPIAGTAVFNAMVSRKSLRKLLREQYANDGMVTRDLVETYYCATHQRGARHAPAAFLTGHLNIEIRQAVRRLAQPALAVWGEDGAQSPAEEFRGFHSLKPDFQLATIPGAGDIPQHERADDFNVIVSAWLNRQSHSSGPTAVTRRGMREDSPPTLPR
jgi:pimeloyl-ACP methyl ester carboxylesterase